MFYLILKYNFTIFTDAETKISIHSLFCSCWTAAIAFVFYRWIFFVSEEQNILFFLLFIVIFVISGERICYSEFRNWRVKTCLSCCTLDNWRVNLWDLKKKTQTERMCRLDNKNKHLKFQLLEIVFSVAWQKEKLNPN